MPVGLHVNGTPGEYKAPLILVTDYKLDAVPQLVPFADAVDVYLRDPDACPL
jgi:hypothetical protein